MPRTVLRVGLGISIAALAIVVAVLVVGDRLFARSREGVRLVYALNVPPNADPASAAQRAADAMQSRFDPEGVRGLMIRPDETGGQVEVVAPQQYAAGIKEDLRNTGTLGFYFLVEPGDSESSVAATGMAERLEKFGPAPDAASAVAMRWLACRGDGSDLPGIVRTHAGTAYVLVHTSPERSLPPDDPNRPWKLRGAQRMTGDSGQSMIGFELDDAGGQYFGDLTGNNIAHPLGIALNGVVVSAPNVNTRITNYGVIEGGRAGFTHAEASQLVGALNAGVGTLPGLLIPDPVTEEPAGRVSVGLSRLVRLVLGAAAAVLGLCVVVLAVLLAAARPSPGPPPLPPARPFPE